MKTRALLLGLLALGAVPGEAALKSFPIKINQPVYEDGQRRVERRHTPYHFGLTVISDTRGLLAERQNNGSPFLTPEPGERYAVELYNPLPVRVAVNLTVDGVNSITGKPSGIADGAKWIVEPHSRVRVSGWQVSQGDARRFFFTEKPGSYAAFRGESLGKNLAANCGVIGAAFFWNQKELDRYFEANPIVRNNPAAYGEYESMRADKMSAMGKAAAPSARAESRAAKDEQEAGTGMGERFSHPTQQVEFTFDRGMYKVSQALLVYYDFAPVPAPNPFPALSFAPEMPY